MKIFSAPALFLLLSANVAAQDITAKTNRLASPADQVIASEKAIWVAEKEKDRHAFEALLVDHYAEVTAEDGFLDRETVLKTFDNNGLPDYSYSRANGHLPFVVSNQV